MVTKRKLREEVIKLNYRIAELEERLCPCEEHDWKDVSCHRIDSTTAIHRYKCKRCGKVREEEVDV